MDKWHGSGRGGLGVSEAARPTSLILAKANAEVAKTVQMPLRLLANAPGSLPIDNMLRVLHMLAWWSIDQWQMQIVIVVFIIIVWLGTHVSSRVVAGVVVELKCQILTPRSGKWEVRPTNRKVWSPEILGM